MSEFFGQLIAMIVKLVPLFFTFLLTFFPRAVAQGIPLLFGSTGETITEKAGHLNLGIPGIMYVGGISGVIGAFLYEQVYIGRIIHRAVPYLMSDHCLPYQHGHSAAYP